jgi:hypothetical protein
VESVFSSIKRRFGDVLHSRSTVLRMKELKLRFLVYNICRESVFLFYITEDFYRAPS